MNIDRNPTSGYGSTSASCAIIRVHYSTFDGCALAYEGYHYWKKWEEYLEYKDEKGLAKFIECGCMIYQTKENDYLKNVITRAQELKYPLKLELRDDQKQTSHCGNRKIWSGQTYLR